MTEQDLNERINKLLEQYMRKIAKKMNKQSGPMKKLVWRTCSTALMVLSDLQGIPFERLSPALYFISLDLDAKELTRKYEAILELAGTDPDKFVDTLHRDLNDISRFIQKHQLVPELLELLAISIRLRLTYHKQHPQVIHVMNAYQNLLIQTLEYLRPSKFDFTVAVCGCSTTGEVLTVPEYNPHGDDINREVQEMVYSGRAFASDYEFNIEFQKITAKYGLPEVQTVGQMEAVFKTERFLGNHRADMAAYINEFTYDMVLRAETAFAGDVDFLAWLHLPGIHMDRIEPMLTKRARTLPTNGMLFRFNYEGDARVPERKRISEIFMKETFHNGRIVMLYNLTVDHQVLAGYFDTAKLFLSSILISVSEFAEQEFLYEKIRALILYLYAAATSRDMETMLNGFPRLAYLAYDEGDDERLQITVTAYAQGGKPKNHYQNKPGDGSRINDERYEAVSRPIQGYIRKLPVGQSASQEARERAMKLGFDLAEDETYVQPFVKNVLRLREREEEDG